MALKIQKTIRTMLWVMFVFAIITIGTAWGFYPETYEFFREAVSALGGIISSDGYPNPSSRVIMTIGFCITGAISLTVGILYFLHKELEFNTIKGMFVIIMGLGAVGIGMPYNKDGNFIIHYAGAFAFLFFFGIFNLTAQIFRFTRKHDRKTPTKNFDYYADLTMGITFFLLLVFYLTVEILVRSGNLDSTIITGPLAQKMVLIGIGIATFLLDLDDI